MKFKCKTTNLIYNFEFEVDIASMLKHPDYESVPDKQEEVKVTSKKQTSTKVTPDESSIDG
jgi:hypothetical protein